MTEQAAIHAYANGWNTAQDWHQPHLNPYVPLTADWWNWWDGYRDGGANHGNRHDDGQKQPLETQS